MKLTFNISKQLFLYAIIPLLFSNCTYNTLETVDKTVKKFPNGKHITVKKVNSETSSHGVLTNRYYGTTHSFKYTLKVTQNNIKWNGGSAEPKNIIFCRDTTYIKYLKEKMVNTRVTDSVTNTIEELSYYEIQEFYEKHFDERYFFNLLGEDYWVPITAEHYTSLKKECNEYPIPNDAELSLEKPENE